MLTAKSSNGNRNIAKAFLSLPVAEDASPSAGERFSSILLGFVPWMVVYETFILTGVPEGAISTNLPFEEHLPVWEFSEVFYSFAFLYSFALPFVIKSRRQLRRFITDIWFMTFLVGLIFLTFPFVVKQRDFVPHSFLGRLIYLERSLDGVTGAFPSGHVVWAFLVAMHFGISFPRFKPVWYSLAVLISGSCIMTGAHSIPDVAAGYFTFLIVIYRYRILKYVLRKSPWISAMLRESD